MLSLLLLAVIDPVAATAKPAAPVRVAAHAKSARTTFTAKIVGEWQDDRDKAWADARQKAIEASAGRPYTIVSSAIAIKGPQRRVKLVVEWCE